MANPEQSLTEHFLEYFSVQLATTPTEREAAYHIRYRVYCEEFGYDDPVQFPDQLERDEYDDTSLHSVILHRNGMPAGCVRLAPALGDASDPPLPFEDHCGDSVDHAFNAAWGWRTLWQRHRLPWDSSTPGQYAEQTENTAREYSGAGCKAVRGSGRMIPAHPHITWRPLHPENGARLP